MKTAENKTGEVAMARQCLGLFVLSILALALVQSSAIVTLTYDLPPSGVTEKIVMAAEGWHGWMVKLGVADVTEWISYARDDFREMTVEE